MSSMRIRLWIAVVAFLSFTACNYTPEGECYPRGEADGNAGVGTGVIVPSGVGGLGDGPDPRHSPPCNSTAQNGGHGGSSGVAAADGSAAAGGSQEALLQQELDDQSAGGLTCVGPTDCVNKCVAEQKYCWAAYAVHPHKPDQTGELYQCIDRFPPAKAGGSYTCLYKFTNGDVCIFAYGSKLGPFTLPAPPPLCVYKTQ
jgi:hypothetical protein